MDLACTEHYVADSQAEVDCAYHRAYHRAYHCAYRDYVHLASVEIDNYVHYPMPALQLAHVVMPQQRVTYFETVLLLLWKLLPFAKQFLPFSAQLESLVYLEVGSVHLASFPTIQMQTLLPDHLQEIQQGPIAQSADLHSRK